MNPSGRHASKAKQSDDDGDDGDWWLVRVNKYITVTSNNRDITRTQVDKDFQYQIPDGTHHSSQVMVPFSEESKATSEPSVQHDRLCMSVLVCNIL